MTAKHRRPRNTAAPLTALALTAALVAPASAAAASAPDAEAFVPGVGSASAGVFRVALRSSGANIGIGLAQTRARYAGAQGNAESAGVDMGMLDMVGKAPIACGTAPGAFLPEDSRPQRLVVSSGEGADEQRSASFGAGTPVEIGSQSGSAAPNSKADAEVGGVRVDIPGLLDRHRRHRHLRCRAHPRQAAHRHRRQRPRPDRAGRRTRRTRRPALDGHGTHRRREVLGRGASPSGRSASADSRCRSPTPRR